MRSDSSPPDTDRPLWGGTAVPLQEADFEGRRKKLLAFNRALERANEMGDPLVSVCVRARCEILQLSTEEYGREIGCAPSSITTFESRPLCLRTFSRPLSGSLRLWSRAARAAELNRSSKRRLQEARDYILEAIDLHFGGGVLGLLMQWKYQCGAEAFESATELSTGYLSALKKLQPEIPPRRLLVWANSLDLIPTNVTAPDMVRHPVFTAIRERYRYEALKKNRPDEVIELQCARSRPVTACYRAKGSRPPTRSSHCHLWPPDHSPAMS